MSTATFIDSASGIASLLTTVKDLPTSPPSLYIDLEGAKLSRYGTISLLTLYILPTNTTYLIDIHNLKETAFTTAAEPTTPTETNTDEEQSSSTLKFILESPAIPKVFFDVRNDSDALFSHYAINLACIHDLQLMELANSTRRFPQYVNGLAKCIQRDSGITAKQLRHANLVKERGLKLFAPERGGSYEVFNERPLQEAVKEYCVQDVVHMPRLWAVYWGRMDKFWEVMVSEAGEERVRESQGEGYKPNDESKKYGCWSEEGTREARGKWNKGVRMGLSG